VTAHDVVVSRFEHGPRRGVMSPTTRKILICAVLTAAFVGIGAGVGVGSTSDSGDDSPDVPISGDALTRAGEAALAETGGGEVVDSEVEDEENGYEVEVNLDDGRQMEVQLDENLAVVSSSENEEGDDGDGD
jgi:hypothetical protein